MTEIISGPYSLERYRSSSASSTSPTVRAAYSPPGLANSRMPPAGSFPPPLPPYGSSNGYSAPPPPPPPSNKVENMCVQSSRDPYMHENGRRYHGYRAGMYLYPNDELEKDRLDIFHKMYSVARKNQLHRTPITANHSPTRILDLGTGTGIWAMDIADMYPEAEIIGVDLSPIQPQLIPRNLRFATADFESEWTLGQSSFDLIHLRNGLGSVTSWPILYRRILQHLKPGYGWMEQVELDFEPRCDDQTLPPNSYTQQWYNYLVQATEQAAKPISYNHNTGSMLSDAGFVEIQETIVRIPYNPWSTQRQQKEIGSWYSLALDEGLPALCMAPFYRMLGWDKHTIENMLHPVKREIMNKKIHAYNELHIWTARRP